LRSSNSTSPAATQGLTPVWTRLGKC
jgi:hypothetical protein